LKRRASPRIESGLTGPRDHLVPPDLLAIGYIVASHVTAEARHLAGAARDDYPIHDDRAAGVLNEEVTTSIALPGPAAGTSVQPYNDIVPRSENDFVAIQRDRALALPVDRWKLFARRQWVSVFPEQVAGRGIDRLNHVARIAQIHDSIVDNRCD